MNAKTSDINFSPISAYLDCPTDLCAPLNGDIDVDVAIVGGGYTGLSTALALKSRGVNAVIIEREFCGFGASGRNAGHLTPTICKDMPTSLMLFGEKRTAQLVRFADHCVETAESMMTKYAIDCDYNPSGNIMATVHPSQEARLRKAAKTAQGVGAKVRFLETGELRERGIPKAFINGALEELGGTFHPGKYVMGLRRTAIELGIKIFEQSEVLKIVDSERPTVYVRGGIVNANKVVIGTNAYTREIGKPGGKIFPFYDTLFETAPLNDGQLAAIGGWRQREGIYTAHESMESYRLTAQRTLIGGSKGVRYFYGGKPAGHGGRADASIDVVVKAFRERLPALAELPIQNAWAGWIAMTLNFLPAVGRIPGSRNILHSIGYNGHGVAQASAMGDVLADMVLERPNEWESVIARYVPTMPPEPLSWLMIRSILGIVNAIDRRIDSKIMGDQL